MRKLLLSIFIAISFIVNVYAGNRIHPYIGVASGGLFEQILKVPSLFQGNAGMASVDVGVEYIYALGGKGFSVSPAIQMIGVLHDINAKSSVEPSNTFWLQVPVVADYKLDINNSFALFCGAGLFGGVRLRSTKSMDRVLDSGIIARVGVYLGRFSIGIGGQFGLLPYEESPAKRYPSLLDLSTGFLF